MTIDIFIKTYHKDFEWLPFCLKSIEKFAKGFRNVVIVSDNDGHIIPPEYLNEKCRVMYVDISSVTPSNVDHGVGYLWQQYIKLMWYKYSDADSVLIMDSDEMFTKVISPSTFKRHGKFTWNYRRWEEADTGICWKKPTDMLLKIDSKYEAMAITGFILQRETTVALKNHLCSIHETNDIWDIFVKHNMNTASEFNVFGSFIHHFDRTEYTQVFDYNPENCINYTIRKAWSWGGISDEERGIRESLLS
jgi:hypothetical protein